MTTPNRAEKYLTKAEKEEATLLYLADELSVRAIALHFGVNHRSIRRFMEREGLPKRSPGWRPQSKWAAMDARKAEAEKAKYNAKVNWGYQKPVQMAPPQSPLERAKDVLRRKGYVVFEPWRFDTSAVKGIVHVDHLRLTADQTLQMAGI